jgi:hypothetical protein
MWKTIEEAISHVDKSFEKAERLESKITSEILSLEGMTGIKTRHLYNNLLEVDSPMNYLEIGVWRGSSFISSMYKNLNVTGIAMDDFNPNYGGPNSGEDNYRLFLENTSKILSNGEKHEVKVKEFYDLDVAELPKVDIYLYDGDHIDHYQYNAFKKMFPCFSDICVVVIDDWNATGVQVGTNKAKIEMGGEIPFEIVHERIVEYTKDGSHTPIDIAQREYWNGIYVAVLRKTN